MNNIISFTNNELGTIRTVLIDNEPYFVGKDVAKALGYTNPQKAIKDHVDEEDRTVNESFTVNGTQGLLINESGLYSLILSSKLPTAKKFKRWVTSEVIPSIRKYGGYIANQDNLTDEELLAKAVQIAQRKIEERDEQIKTLENDNEAMKPKALFADCVSASKQCITVAELAKFISQHGNVHIGEKRLFQYFRDNGYLMNRVIDRNTPTQKSIELGLFNTEEIVITDSNKTILSKAVKVTPKGQQYFINKIKNI
jgi:anti-repressor protein